jgi:RNA polymerase sigma-70 factor, ECF subfamily
MTDASVNLEGHVDSITTTLLNEARQGDERAWHRLVDVYLPLVFYWCRRQGLQDADVLDVGQEVLQRLAKHLGKFRREGPQDTFRGWLRQVTQSALGDHYRRQQRQLVGRGGSTAQKALANVPEPEFEDSASTRTDEAQILYCRVVDLVRSEFSEQDWQAFHMVMVDNRTPTEVAQALRISRNRVYLAKSRIQKRLREEFGDYDE